MKITNLTPRLVLATGAAALAGAAGGAGSYALLDSGSTTIVREIVSPAPSSAATATPAAATDTLSVNEIYRRSKDAVVEITVTSAGSPTPFGGSPSQQAQGSGFVYDAKGDIVTNQHVVDGASSITVRFASGATYKATLVGADASTDLAVIKVAAPSSILRPLTLADSSALQVGDGVIAIGSPFGLEGSTTTGIVSALKRQITSPNNFTIDNAIQTDAAINQGNSGGPLLDTTGSVIGVNTQIESRSGGNDGVGFAVPSGTVRSIAGQLVASGSVKRAYLGVSVETVPASVAGRLGLAAGAQVATVRPGTPAAAAGLRAATGTTTVGGRQYSTGGDVITAVGGKAVADADELRAAIDARRPGDRLTLTIDRAGETKTVTVTLDARPES